MKDTISNKMFSEIVSGIDECMEETSELSKGLPTGYINKYGKQKQGDGTWKYVGKGGTKNADLPKGEDKKESSTSKPKEEKKDTKEEKKDYSAWNKKELEGLRVDVRVLRGQEYLTQFEKTLVSDVSNALQKQFKDKKLTQVILRQVSTHGGSWDQGAYSKNITRLGFNADGVEHLAVVTTGKIMGGKNSDNFLGEVEIGSYDHSVFTPIYTLNQNTGFLDNEDNLNKKKQKQSNLVFKHGLAKKEYNNLKWSKKTVTKEDKDINTNRYEYLYAASLLKEAIEHVK